MRGAKSEIFGGLIHDPSTTVDGFITEATNIKRALAARARHHHWLDHVSTLAFVRPKLSTNANELRKIIQDIVREEL